MNQQQIQDAIKRFEKEILKLLIGKTELYKLRSEFVAYFDKSKIKTMSVNDYVVGVKRPEIGFNFCYGLERQLEQLGNINGSTAFKFGIFYGRTKSNKNYEYRFTQKFGTTYKDAFECIRNAITTLLLAGEIGDIEKIITNPFATMLKGKILSTYFPDKYLNIFSSDHLNDYLKKLGLATPIFLKSDPVIKRKELISYKNQHAIMKGWTVDIFATFLWTEILNNNNI